MPTNDRLSLTAALAWLRAQVDRLRRSVMARRPVVRWSAALLAVIGLTSVVYWAATSFTTLGVRYLVSGRQFSSDDLIKVCTALDKQRISYRVDDSRRVEVAADQYDQAADVVSKLELGQRPIDDIRKQSYMSSFFDLTSDKENKRQLYQEKFLEGLIGRLDGVVWSLVSINLPPPKWPRTGAKPTAFVYIETEGNRKLPGQTQQAIIGILTGNVRNLTPETITVMDRHGVRYLDSGNPAIGVASRDRAREEDLVKEILDKLDWIKGVQVQVKVNSPPIAEPAAPAASSGSGPSHPVAPDQISANKTGNPTPKSELDNALPAMRVNQAPAPEPEPDVVPMGATSAVANRTGTNPPAAGHSGAHEPQRKQEPGWILINVPRSYYLNADIRLDSREPTRDELRLMAERTENQIRRVVSLATPSNEAWKVDIVTIPDEVSLSRPVNLESSEKARRRVLDWGIVGTVVAVVSILAALGSWIQVARRPVATPEPALQARRYHADLASEPGPSERVRELVRRNPEAAASVLQRWTGQGGRV